MPKTGLLRQAARAVVQFARGNSVRTGRTGVVAPQQPAHTLHTASAAAALPETDLQRDMKRKHLKSTARPPGAGDDVRSPWG